MLSVIHGLLFNLISPGKFFYWCMPVNTFIQFPIKVIELMIYIIKPVVPVLYGYIIPETFRGKLGIISDEHM